MGSLIDTLPLFELPPPIERPELEYDGPLSIQQAFELFDAANPWVFEKLSELALDLVERGHERIGIAMLFEVVRWNVMRATSDESSRFKLNNNMRSRYARKLMDSDPRLAGKFEIRELHDRTRDE